MWTSWDCRFSDVSAIVILLPVKRFAFFYLQEADPAFNGFALLVFIRIGDYVTFGGRVAVRDHVSIVSKVLIPFF